MRKLLILSLILFLTTSVLGQFKPPMGTQVNIAHPLSDFVAFWPMWEGSGGQVFDLSGNGNTGTFINTPVWVPGKTGAAIDFSGGGADDKITFGTNVGTVGATKLTLGVRVKFDTLPTGGASQTHLIGRWPGHDQKNVIACRIIDSTTARLLTGDNVDEKSSNITIPAISTGIWYDMVWTYDAGVGSFYLDGVNQGSFAGLHAQLNPAPTPVSVFTIGVDEAGFGDLDGQIDHAKAYKRIPSVSEIALLYREPFCMFEEGLSVTQMYSDAAPPVGEGQVIIITAMIPLLIIPALIFIKKKNIVKKK